MSRELPYFKFFTGEWLNGDIALEDYELQGLFINVCSYYWHRDCELTSKQLNKKFQTDIINYLIPEFIEIDDSGYVQIDFLNEQFNEFTLRKRKLSEAGKKGAENKKLKAKNKPPLNNPLTTREDKKREDKSKIKRITIEDRKATFEKSLIPYNEKYDVQMIKEFTEYWTEHGINDNKMRFEKEKSFGLGRRLSTWKNNQKIFNNGNKKTTQSNRARATNIERKQFV